MTGCPEGKTPVPRGTGLVFRFLVLRVDGGEKQTIEQSHAEWLLLLRILLEHFRNDPER